MKRIGMAINALPQDVHERAGAGEQGDAERAARGGRQAGGRGAGVGGRDAG